MASPFGARVLPRHYRYVQWPAGMARNPQVLVEAGFARILASGAWFCRKLDSVSSAPLRARLDGFAACAACDQGREGQGRQTERKRDSGP